MGEIEKNWQPAKFYCSEINLIYSIRALELQNLNIEYCLKPRDIGILKSEYWIFPTDKGILQQPVSFNNISKYEY